MKELSKEYLFLFNAISDIERALARLRCDLICAQRQAEEMFLQDEEEPPEEQRGA